MLSTQVQFFCYYKAPTDQAQSIEAAQHRLFRLLCDIAPLSFSRKFAPIPLPDGAIEQEPAQALQTWLEFTRLPPEVSPEGWLKVWREASVQSGLIALLPHGQHIEWFEAMPPCA
jgi:hypothetical protein